MSVYFSSRFRVRHLQPSESFHEVERSHYTRVESVLLIYRTVKRLLAWSEGHNAEGEYNDRAPFHFWPSFLALP